MKTFAIAAPLFALSVIVSTAVPGFAALPDRHSQWTGQTLTAKNGAKVTAFGSKLTIATADGKSTVIDRSDPAFVNQKMPVAVPMASCAKLATFIQLYPLTDITWRRAVVAYMNRCL
jgi:hypothetical protein